MAALVGIFAVGTAVRQDRTFSAPTPDVHASKDPAVIERGRYLVRGPAHCVDCHGQAGLDPKTNETAAEPILGGGQEFHLPVGTFRVPNITPDPEAGIGRYKDEDIARVLRYGVRPNGHGVVPFMPFANLTDEDLGAIVSYLRTLPPSSNRVKPHEPNTTGKLLLAWVVDPRGPSEPVRASIERAPTANYGRYLAHSVANCVGCHTKVDMRTGAFSGPLFGGGAVHASLKDPNKKFVAPNLTPDSSSGWIADWSEDLFVARLKSGRVHDGSPMPWPAFQRMSDDDLRAIYRYLKTLPPASGGPDPSDRGSVLMTAAR